MLVGFAAETPTADSSLLELGRAKLTRKGCDVLVLNEVGEHKAFGRPDNEIVLLTDGRRRRTTRRQQGLSRPSHLGLRPAAAVSPVS